MSFNPGIKPANATVVSSQLAGLGFSCAFTVPIVDHFSSLFTGSHGPHSAAEIASLGWMPPVHLLARGDAAPRNLLTRGECAAIMEATGRNVFSRRQASLDANSHQRNTDFDKTAFFKNLINDMTTLILVNATLAFHRITRDYPGRQVATVMRDGLVIAMPDHYLGHRLLGNVLGLYWPGMNVSRATTPAQTEFAEFRRRIQREAQSAFYSVNSNPRTDDMIDRFYRSISRSSGADFLKFVDHIAGQIEESGIGIDRDVLLYDTWGSGKTAILIASALMALYPQFRIDVLMGAAYRDTRGLPSVMDEYDPDHTSPLDAPWPFTEVLDEETGLPKFTFGRRASEQASPIPGIASALASYNLAARINGGFSLEMIKGMAAPDRNMQDLGEFLFPSSIPTE